MSFYSSSDHLYDCVQLAFSRIQENNPNALDDLAKSQLVIRFLINEPEAEILFDGRSQPVATSFGSSQAKAAVEITLSGNTLHQIMLGELAILKALGAKKINVKGSIMKVKALSSLFRHSQEIYPQVLKEKGLVE